MKNAGSKFGLNLRLNVQQDEYTSLFTEQAGFMVLIHDQETPPMVEEFGFSVEPGTNTFAALSKQKVICIQHLHFICRRKFHVHFNPALWNPQGEQKLVRLIASSRNRG